MKSSIISNYERSDPTSSSKTTTIKTGMISSIEVSSAYYELYHTFAEKNHKNDSSTQYMQVDSILFSILGCL
jgi:hypothetical protein